MGATPIYELPYPGTADPPHGPNQLQALADAVEPELSRIDTSLTPLNAIFVSGATVEYGGSATAGDVDTSAWTPDRSAGSPVRGNFVVPPSGKVKVFFRVRMRNKTSTVSTMLTSFIVRTGSTPGSGTIVQDADDNVSIQHTGLADLSAGNADLVPGLTPGSTYNIEMVYRRTSGGVMVATAPWVLVEPVWV